MNPLEWGSHVDELGVRLEAGRGHHASAKALVHPISPLPESPPHLRILKLTRALPWGASLLSTIVPPATLISAPIPPATAAIAAIQVSLVLKV